VTTFTKVWVFRNGGEESWPIDSKFIQTNGDNMGAETFTVGRAVLPGEEIEIAMELTSPELPGKYCAFFRFVYGDNLRFGQKVWCDILVEEKPRGSSLLEDQFDNIESIREPEIVEGIALQIPDEKPLESQKVVDLEVIINKPAEL